MPTRRRIDFKEPVVLARLIVALSLLLAFCLHEGCSRKCERQIALGSHFMWPRFKESTSRCDTTTTIRPTVQVGYLGASRMNSG